MTKLLVFAALLLTSCVSHPSAGSRGVVPTANQEILYASSDLRQIFIFAQDGFHAGPVLEFVPEYPPPPVRYFETSDGVQCASIGHSDTTDFAIKRPIRVGERYRCGTTLFRVAQCFDNCRAAIIEIEARLVNNGTLTSHMYVDNCSGVLVFSQTGNLTEGIPLSAAWLRGDVGILPHRDYPNCARILSSERHHEPTR